MNTRRNFLRHAAGALAFSSVPWSARAAEGGISLGMSLYGMKTVPLPEALKTCAKIGYSSVEFALNAGFPTEPKVFTAEARKEAVALLQSLKLGLPCVMLNLSLAANDQAHAAALDSLRETATLVHELVPANPPMIETVLGGKPAEWEQIKGRMVDRLHSWAETATQAKIAIAIKAHVGSAVNSPERLLWLIDQVKSPAISVAYDYSHFELMGIPMAESMNLLLPHTKFIHVKDTVGEEKKFQFLLPGEGRTDYVAYFKILKEHQYTGPVIVEVSAQIFNKPGYDPVAAATKCFAPLAGAMEKAGVARI
ncbi:MAG: Xylose isomerase domain protein barrel [Verrucomicrobiaceae bacterium]|nr:Xylose isomerase domain protein barrel [Verrucomicrobiaceae bacterium]